MNGLKSLIGEINRRVRDLMSIADVEDVTDETLSNVEGEGINPIRIQVHGLATKPSEGKALLLSDNGNVANSVGIVLGDKKVGDNETVLYGEGDVKIEAGATKIVVTQDGKVAIENGTGDLIGALDGVIKALQGLTFTSNPAGIVTITGTAPLATSPSGVMRAVIPAADVAIISSFAK